MRGTAKKETQTEMACSSSTPARLTIPTLFEASDEFRARVTVLLAQPDTHLYIDTSFLMWATKIGPASRDQLLAWLRDDVGERAHVPTWSAHEYLRHHVANTIVDELTKKTSEIAQLAGSTFSYFRPFLDDPALPAAEAWDRLRSSTREAINTFVSLAEAAKGWRRAYPTHAAKIIAYINERVLPVGSLYDNLPSITEQGGARFEGRIPPGYQDRNKRGEADVDNPEEQSVSGANRYGDLIFWKEALEHARNVGAAAVIILTNDRKNDWRMGGENRSPIDQSMLLLKKSWRPVPVIHPMLALEAKMAGIAEVALLDSEYLAICLRGVAETDVGAFVDVAIVPDPPAPLTEKQQRAAAVAERVAQDEEEAQRVADEAAIQASDDGFRFPDDPAVKSTRRALAEALLKSRGGADERGQAILARVRANVEGAETFCDVLTRDELAGMDQVALVSLARGLHDKVVAGEPGYADALTDLVGLLDELPLATAGAIFLGLLASMYLETGLGTTRTSPKSPVANMLLEKLERPFADLASAVIAQRLKGNPSRPLYIPTEESVEVRFDIEPESMEPDELRSMRIAGVEVITAAQDDPSLRLREILGAETAMGAEIMAAAASRYTVPRSRMDATGDEQTEYRLTELVGLRSPDQVSRTKEDE